MRAGAARRQHPVVGRAEADPQERRAEEQQDGDDGDRDQQRPPHHATGDAVPEALVLGLRRSVPEDAERVDPGADDGEQRRQGDDRRDHRQQHDGDAGVGERAQEVQREHEQRRERHGDGEGAERHGAPGGLDGADDGVVDAAPGAQLLAEAGDDEQAVVDGQAEPERRRQVDREDRHVGERADARTATGTCRARRRRRRTAAATPATSPPNTSTSRTSVIGTAISSARPRSPSIVVAMSRLAASSPPTAAVIPAGGSAARSRIASMAASSSSPSASSVVSTRARSPAVLRSDAAPSRSQ